MKEQDKYTNYQLVSLWQKFKTMRLIIKDSEDRIQEGIFRDYLKSIDKPFVAITTKRNFRQ